MKHFEKIIHNNVFFKLKLYKNKKSPSLKKSFSNLYFTEN